MTKLTTQETYKLLNVSRTTLYLWTKKGHLTAYKDPISLRVFYDKQEVLKLKNREFKSIK